jgi:hypothetical protein
MRQVEDHVFPGLTRCVPTICMLLSTLFQECHGISNFAIYMLLLKNTTITEQIMSLSILESKPEELIMYRVSLNSV